MSDNISKISDDFKDLLQLKLENQAQFKIITNLTKSNDELKTQIKHLESMLDKTVPNIVPIENKIQVNDPEVDISKMEIIKLRNKSLIEALTFEDAKRLEVFTKIINQSRNQNKPIEAVAKRLSNDELIKSLETANE